MDNLLSVSEAAQLIKVNPETLRRWDNEGRLVAVKINERGDRRYKKEDLLEFVNSNPKLIKYSQVLTYNGYSIRWDSQGFNSMPANFSLIARLVVSNKENPFVGFAFVVDGLSLFATPNRKTTVDQLAIEKVKQYIDKKHIFNGDVYTFEFRNNNFVEVSNPDWWDGKYGVTLLPGLRVEVAHSCPEGPQNTAWRVILNFKSVQGDFWVTNNFGSENKFIEYFAWIESKELTAHGYPNSARYSEILAIDFIRRRFEETKDSTGNRDIARILENNSALYDGDWHTDSMLPDRTNQSLD